MRTTHIVLVATALSLLIVSLVLWRPWRGPEKLETSAIPAASEHPRSLQTDAVPKPKAEPAHYRPVPASDGVRLKVEKLQARLKGMSPKELKADKEVRDLANRYITLINDPKVKAKVEAAQERLKQASATQHGSLHIDFEGFDEPAGRAWLEAVLSGDPEQAGDWLIHRLEGAAFEFASDPNAEKSSDGVRVTAPGTTDKASF